MAIEDLDNLEVTKLTVEVAPTKPEIKEKRSLIEKIKYIFKR